MKKYTRKSVIVKCIADLFLPLACVFGCYVIFHGSSSPGGGFQGGVLVASAILLVYLGYGAKGIRRAFRSGILHSTETVAEIMYIFIALFGIFTGLGFGLNFVFSDSLESTMLMNDLVGYHVMAGLTCLLIIMLGQLGGGEEEK